MAEQFVQSIVQKMQEQVVPIESTPMIVQAESVRQKLGLNPKQINQLSQRVVAILES